MNLDIEKFLYILLYVTFLISVFGCLTYLCKGYRIRYIIIKNRFLKRLKYSKKLGPKQYIVFQKYNIWWYYSLY